MIIPGSPPYFVLSPSATLGMARQELPLSVISTGRRSLKRRNLPEPYHTATMLGMTCPFICTSARSTSDSHRW